MMMMVPHAGLRACLNYSHNDPMLPPLDEADIVQIATKERRLMGNGTQGDSSAVCPCVSRSLKKSVRRGSCFPTYRQT